MNNQSINQHEAVLEPVVHQPRQPSHSVVSESVSEIVGEGVGIALENVGGGVAVEGAGAAAEAIGDTLAEAAGEAVAEGVGASIVETIGEAIGDFIGGLFDGL